MAADSRQFTEHNEVGGVNVYYEDKRMEELKSATAKTSSQVSTTTDYIPLQDTDGNLVKINLASFEEAVRNVLGGLLANNDKGTTISGIPALSGSGANLDFGSVTPANLASVLGGINNITFPTSGDVANITEQGIYLFDTHATNTPDNTSYWYITATKTNVASIINLLAYKNDASIVYSGQIRSGAVTWYRLDNFGYSDLGSLASAVGSILNISNFVYESGNASETVRKTNTRQGLLYCCINQGQPSLFAFGRTSITSTIVEGSIKATNISINDSGTEIVITKATTKYLYVILLGF